MKKATKISLIISGSSFLTFIAWTLLVSLVDVKAIGPEGAEVGFSTINAAIRDLIGSHMMLYTVTDWLSLIPIAFMLGFALLGLIQWIKRKRITAVDFSILALGAFYVILMSTYLLFEYLVINYRPLLIDGVLEASYPSSTTMLVLCVMCTSAILLYDRIKSRAMRFTVIGLIAAFSAFMVIGRIISGVHWFSDIIGGVLISASFVSLYFAVLNMKKRLDKETKQWY